MAGTINVATYTQNNASRPGNSSRANAYAANTEKVSWPTRMTAVISAVTTKRSAEPGVGQAGVVRPASVASDNDSGVPVAELLRRR